MVKKIIDTIHFYYPDVQAVYLFGSYAEESQNAGSDVDLALLLPHEVSKPEGSLSMSPVRFTLEKELKKVVDVVNLRLVSTVFQKEIIAKGKRIHCGDEYAADTFEMLVFSLYIKLNEERREILEEFYRSKRAYNV
jgi:predicted nucleotidyltransferase